MKSSKDDDVSLDVVYLRIQRIEKTMEGQNMWYPIFVLCVFIISMLCNAKNDDLDLYTTIAFLVLIGFSMFRIITLI